MTRAPVLLDAPPRAARAAARGRPVMVAIAGDSAAGKTTLAGGIVRLLGTDRVTILCTDDYHRFDRAERAALDITPLHPDCNHVDIVEQHLELLAAGRSILKPVYDHSRGMFAPPEYVTPRAVVLVEGLLPLLTPRMRRCFDVAIYLDPPEDLRHVWKVRRDCAKRGYTPDQVLAELRRRAPDSEAFIRPQRRDADVVVRFAPPATDEEHLDAHLVIRSSRAHVDLSPHLDPARPGARVRLDRDGGKPVDVLEIDGDVPAETVSTIECALEPRFPARTVRLDRDHVEGGRCLHLTQMVLASAIASVRAAT